MNAVVKEAEKLPLKLDLGCGRNKQQGFIGIDQYDMEGVDLVIDLREDVWYVDTYKDEAILERLVGESVPGSDELAYKFADNSVDEVYCSHFLEHLTNLEGKWERVKFFNELYRVMKPGAKCSLVTPHWCSSRYYGDPTHKEPFSEWGFFYLNKAWRLGTEQTPAQAPHADVSFNPHGYSCDFDTTAGYNLHGDFVKGRSDDYKAYGVQWYKEVCTDILATLVKRSE